ncbi:unnamed protein product [Plutella xylostella]|uniref:(diamondback moth) hypothetical protein n=1 Tax=Plutella xylostella TaxID=51655 RepID=A0A8S4D0M4_PLUXY|nr:unnamed protein product [Plutella xylostella]
MYRMVKTADDFTNLQCIVWRDNPDEDIESYKLTRVTFVRTLNQLADDEGHEHPEYTAATNAIKNCFYMDDLMTGHDDVEEAKQLCQNIKEILRKGGFIMQKWSSNEEELQKFLKEGDDTKDTIEIKLDKVIRILGLTWDRKNDNFNVTVNLPDAPHPITKRSILSDVARLFDPFGWVSPVVITAKIMIQRLWLSNLSWDDELPVDLCEEWLKYREDLTDLRMIEIPRWLQTTPRSKEVQIHGFADASSSAYAAVTYLRVVDEHDVVHVTMIASRTKVAPIKQLSIPRLELCAAVMLSEQIADVSQLLEVSHGNIFAYTDSMVVLAWLQAHPNRWKTFVANRVAEILRIIDNERWRHITTNENPADIASRGIRAADLPDYKIWWNGPEWLKSNDIEYVANTVPATDLEERSSFHTRQDKTHEEESPIWERFSNITRMKRVLALCKRFAKPKESKDVIITADEMEDILQTCIRYYQNEVYGRDIEDLKKKGKVRNKSSLITLSPFLDKNGIMKVGGRLQNAEIAETAKHPIIIPKGVHITNLIMREAHIKTLHGGNLLMMTYIRSRYWIIGLKAAVRNHVRSCKTCIIDKAKVRKQLMGQLPAVRVRPHRAFLNSGVDYAGPVHIRMSKGRGQKTMKAYICLFVCMATRAIHLEAVTDLTAQGFMSAYRRFVARRGHCAHLWSDNGTNFVGSAKELKVLFEEGKANMSTQVAELLANDGTTWHFIPPRMPNYGGLWEAGVQSAKRHLTRVNGDTKLTYEEMATLLAQIEACLNSRPLCQLDNTLDTLTPLTPGHFLIGEPLITVPDMNYEDKNVNLLTRWQLIQRMTQDFWRRWQNEYLNTLQQRYKWQERVPAPKIGDIVVIKQDDLPPTKWLLGIIKNVHPGADNLVRVVTVQCKGQTENSWRCSVCRRKAAPRLPPAAQDSTDSLLDVPVLDSLQRRHSEARLGGGSSSTALAPPRSPELRRHSDVSPASLKELEKLKGGGSKTPEAGESRRPSAAVVSPVRRRSMRMPRQRSCDEDKPDAPPAAGLGAPAISRRASAVDVLGGGGGGSRRPSYRAPDDAADAAPQIAGLSVDEDRPIRRRGSQLPDIAALQQRTSALGAMSGLAPRGSDASSEPSAASIAAARQMSVDAEAIKIVIHDVDDRNPRRVTLRRDPNDKGHRSRGFGMRVVGGKPDASGRREAVIVWTVPGGPADLAGLQQGDKVLEWAGVPLTDRSFEEVCAVVEHSVESRGDSVELLVCSPPPEDHAPPPGQHPPSLLFEPETDKSPSSPTRRKLPKTPTRRAWAQVPSRAGGPPSLRSHPDALL